MSSCLELTWSLLLFLPFPTSFLWVRGDLVLDLTFLEWVGWVEMIVCAKEDRFLA